MQDAVSRRRLYSGCAELLYLRDTAAPRGVGRNFYDNISKSSAEILLFEAKTYKNSNFLRLRYLSALGTVGDLTISLNLNLYYIFCILHKKFSEQTKTHIIEKL